ncbi:MAG: hypothetical protein ACFB0C_07930 [Leptolyngbyaceae cyanobacterium]
MMVSSTADTVTLALAEQLRLFTWLQSVERHLMLWDGGTHFSAIHNAQAGEEAIPLSGAVIGPYPELAQRYLRIMGLAFFQTHLAGDESYRQYLDPTFANVLSQSDMTLSLVQELMLAE